MSLAGIRKVGTTMHCWKGGCFVAVNVSTSTYNRSNILAGNKMSDLFIGIPKRGASNLTVRCMFRNYKTHDRAVSTSARTVEVHGKSIYI
jgi:hypothetical protein